VITDAVAIALLSAKPTCSGTELHTSRLLDYRIMHRLKHRAQTALRNHERGEQLCWKRCSLLSSVHLILYSSRCIAVYRLVTKTVRHPIVSAAGRGAKPSWNPAKDKCDRIRECKQTPTRLQARVSQYRCQFMNKKHTNCIKSTLHVCLGLMETKVTDHGEAVCKDP